MPITITSPNPTTPVTLLRPDWQPLVATRALLSTDDDIEKTHPDNLATSLPVTLSWQGGTPPYTVELTSPYHSATLTALLTCTASLTNLHTATTYTCHITDAHQASATTTFTTLPGPRLIALPEPDHAPVNIRDIGGYESLFGGRVRQGLLYRGSHTHAYFPASIANASFITDTLGVKTQLDLRYPQSVIGQTHSNFGSHIRWIHAPINAYHSFTPEQNEIFRHALQTFARPELYPIYFHCQGGSDRTGEIAFLINGLLGVSDTDLFHDYELSSLSLFPRPITTPYFQEWLAKITSHAPAGAPRHQQIESYMTSIGITPSEITTIRKTMLTL